MTLKPSDRRRHRWPSALALLGALALGAATADPSHPGYVDLDHLPALDGAPTVVDVRLDGWLLGLAREAARQADEPEAKVLEGIDSLRIRVFDGADVAGDLRRATDGLIGELRRQGWEDFTTIRNPDGYVSVLVRGSADRLDGMTVVVASADGEAIFVNIAGRLRADVLAQLLDATEFVHGDLDIDF